MTRPPSSDRERDAALERLLPDAVAAARAAWPTIDLPAGVIASYITDRLPEGVDVETALSRMHTSDLYLACGCAVGNASALAAFDRHCLDVVDRALPRLGMSADVVAEVKQRLRRTLLVAEHDSPRIVDFEGRGQLRRWVRVMAVHEALGMARQTRRHPQVDSDALDESVMAAENIELDYLKRKYRDEFRSALGEALRKLSDKDRLLLKQQFLDGLGINEIARLHRVHRATVTRWLDRARAAVRSHTREVLMRTLDVPPAELDSIMRLIHSRLEASLQLLYRRRKP